MPHPGFVNVDFETRIFFYESAGRTSVVQMNVCEQNGMEVGNVNPACAQQFPQV